MIQCRRILAAIIVGLSLFVKPACAFWPVFDFTEFPQVFPQGKAVADAYKNIKSQVEEVKGVLKEIGSCVRTVAQFGRSLASLAKDMVKVAKVATQIVNDVTGANINFTDKMEGAVNNISRDVQNRTNSTVTNINGELGRATSIVNTGLAAAELGETVFEAVPTSDSQELPTEVSPQKKLAPQVKRSVLPKLKRIDRRVQELNTDLDIEEEEEEEEVDEVEEAKAAIRNVFVIFEQTRKENELSYKQINSTFENEIYNLNEGAAHVDSVLSRLEKLLTQATREIPNEQRTTLLKRLEDLSDRERLALDSGISLAEEMRDDYKRQYQEKVLDGLDNYEKVVRAYILGNVEKEEVDKSGAQLKEDIKTLNVDSQLAELRKNQAELQKIQKEAEVLLADIQQAIEDKNKKI